MKLTSNSTLILEKEVSSNIFSYYTEMKNEMSISELANALDIDSETIIAILDNYNSTGVFSIFGSSYPSNFSNLGSILHSESILNNNEIKKVLRRYRKVIKSTLKNSVDYYIALEKATKVEKSLNPWLNLSEETELFSFEHIDFNSKIALLAERIVVSDIEEYKIQNNQIRRIVAKLRKRITNKKTSNCKVKIVDFLIIKFNRNGLNSDDEYALTA